MAARLLPQLRLLEPLCREHHRVETVFRSVLREERTSVAKALAFCVGGVVLDLLDALLQLREPVGVDSLLLDVTPVELFELGLQLWAARSDGPADIAASREHDVLAHLDVRQDLRP